MTGALGVRRLIRSTEPPGSLRARRPYTNPWFQLGIALQPAANDVSATIDVVAMGAP